MRFITILIFCLIGVTSVAQQYLFPIALNGKWGLVTQQGGVICEPIYDYIEFVPQAKKYIYYLNNKKGLINSDGKILTHPIYDQVILHDTIWISSVKDKKWNLFSKNKTVLNHSYLKITKIDNNLFYAKNKKSSIVYDPIINSKIEGDIINASVQNNFVLCQFSDSTYSIYNRGDLMLIDNNIKSIQQTKLGLLKVFKANSVQLFNTRSLAYIGSPIKKITFFSHNIFLCESENGTSIYNYKLNKFYKVPSKIELVKEMNNVVIFKRDKLIGVFDLEAQKIIIQTQFEGVRFVQNGFIVRNINLYGYHNQKGKEIVPCQYSEFNIYDYFIVVQKDNEFGLYSVSGEKIESAQFKKIKVFDGSVKCYKKDELTVVKYNKNGAVTSKKTYQNYLSVSIGKEKLPRQIFKDVKYGKDAEVDAEMFGWFRPVKTKVVKDSVVEYLGRWGLKNENDSVMIRPRFGFVKVFPKIGLTKCYHKSFGNQRNVKIGLYNGQLIIRDSPSFVLVDQDNQKILSPRKFYYVNMDDFKTKFLARGFSTHPVLLDGQAKIIIDSLTFYSNYQDNILRICKKGNVQFTNKPTTNHVANRGDLMKLFGGGGDFYNQKPFMSIHGGQWHFINAKGEQLNEKPFQFAYDFIDGKAIVQNNNKWGVVDSLMNVIVPIVYNSVLRKVIDNKHYFVVSEGVNQNYLYDKNSSKLTKSNIESISNYANGLWIVKYKGDDRWSLIDTVGNIFVKNEYDKVYSFVGDEAIVVKRGKKSILSSTGENLIPFYRAKKITKIGKGKYAVKQKRGVMVIQNFGDTLLMNKICKTVVTWNDNYLVYTDFNNALKILSYKIEVQLPKKSSIISYALNDEKLLLKKNGKIKLFDLKTNEYASKKLLNIESIGEGVMIYKNSKGLFGYMSFKGDTLSQAVFKKLDPINNGWAFAIQGKTKMIVNKKGKALFDFPIYRFVEIGNDYIISTKTGKGLITNDGKVKIPPLYGRIELYNSIFYKVLNKNNQYDLFDLEGNKINMDSFDDIKAIGKQNMVVTYKKSDYLFSSFLDKSLSFQKVLPFSSHVFLLNERQRYGVYNDEKEIIIPIRYHKIQIVNKSFQVKFFNSFGFYLPTGKVLFEPYSI